MAGEQVDSPKKRRGRPPIPQEVQRRRLLTAAANVFATNPYETIRVADIVREAGMSSRSFYEHFSAKEDVAIEMIHMVLGAFVRNLERIFEETDDPIERVDRGLALALEIFSGAAWDLNELSGAAGTRAVEARTHWVRRISAMVVRVLEDAHAAGQIENAPDPAAVELMITGVEGMGLRYLAEGRGQELRGLHPILMGLLVRAFVQQP